MNATTQKSVELAVRTENALVEMGEKLVARMREQRGQTAAEYLGVIVVIAVIVLALAKSKIGEEIGGKIKDLIGQIAGGGNAPKGG
jgi:Flp pilus assembly pilin Flp